MSGPPAELTPLVLTGVSVVDTRDGSVVPAQDVTIVAGRISAIGPAGGPHPDNAHLVDAEGRYVVPGFVDTHAHPLNDDDPSNALQLMLAYGITGFRQMSGTATLLRRRREGALTLPPLSPALLGMPGAVLSPMNAGTPDKAVASVRAQAAGGADFIKTALVTPEVFFAAQQEAQRIGIPILGHLPSGIDVRAASRGQIRSIEHVGPGIAIPAACSSDEQSLRAAIPVGRQVKLPPFALPGMDRLVNKLLAKIVINPLQTTSAVGVTHLRRAVDTFDEAKARDLARQFADDEVWHCPTLIRVRTQEQCGHADFRRDPDLRFMAPKTVNTWTAAAASFDRKFSAEDRATFDGFYALQLRLVGILSEEGVSLLAGTDAVGAVWVVAGSSMHREFDEMAKAGLSPVRILQAATLDAARFLRTESDAGTVEVGKLADLVLLDADPTVDHAALHSLSGVIRAGTFYSSVALEAMKDEVIARGGVA